MTPAALRNCLIFEKQTRREWFIHFRKKGLTPEACEAAIEDRIESIKTHLDTPLPCFYCASPGAGWSESHKKHVCSYCMRGKGALDAKEVDETQGAQLALL